MFRLVFIMCLLILNEVIIYFSSGLNTFASYILIFSFIGLLTIYFYEILRINLSLMSIQEKNLIFALVALKLFITALLFVFIYLIHFPNARLLPPDAEIIHIPQILSWYEYFTLGVELETLTRFGRYYLSNLFFAIIYLGTDNLLYSIITGIIVLFLANIFLIYKNCNSLFKNEKFHGGVVSLMILFGAPSFTYYSLQLYKEGMFYLLINLFVMALIRKSYFWSIVLFSLISYERFYSGFLIALAFLIMLFINSGSIKRIVLLALSPILFYSIFLLFFPDFSLVSTLVIVKGFAGNHAVSDAGFGSKFPFSMLQIALTPIPNFFKFEYWNYQDRLLISAFVFSFVTIISFLLCKTKSGIGLVKFCWYLYPLYLLLWSAMAPFNGRARDAIYPFLIILVCNFIGNNYMKNWKVIKV